MPQYQSGQTDQIERLTVQSGQSFDICLAERVIDNLDGVKVQIIDVRHLRAIKQAGSRPKDLDDLIHLEGV